MRIVPILTAIIAAAALYAFLIERDAFLGFVRASVGKATGAQSADTNVTESAIETQTASQLEEPENILAGTVRVIAIRLPAEPVVSGVTVRGQSEALRFVDVRSQRTGIVISEPKRKGSFVSKGEEICTLDSGTSKAELAEAEARLTEARQNNNTVIQLAEGGFASQTQKTAAKAALETAEAVYERVKDRIARLTMKAPFDGLLESDTAEIGSLLQPGSLCATIIQLNPINVVGYISEIDVEKIDLGDSAQIRFLSGRMATGTVKFVSRSADNDTRTFRMELTVENPDLKIRDGSAAEVFITTNNEMGHLLPQSALTLSDAGQLGVRIIENGTAKFYAIKIIRDSIDGVWVTGLPELSDVIVVGHEYVVDGTPVIASYREDPA